MASYNNTNHHSAAAVDVLGSSLAAGGSNTQQHNHHQHHHHPQQHLQIHQQHHQQSQQQQQQQHFERSSSSSTTSTTYLVPVTSSHLPLDSSAFLSASPHFVTSNPVSLSSHTASNSSSSYTFVQIKREPCQVSEVTTSNTNNHHHTIGSIAAASSSSSLSSLSSSAAGSLAAASKTMSSSTLTTLVKIEASSPKVHEMDKSHLNQQGGANVVNSSNNTVPIGIAVARKRPQETTAPPPPAPPSLTSSSTLPLSQSLNKDMNCFGIRVADLGGVGTGCGNIYFTGNGDLMTSSAAADELALANAASLQSVNRAPSTFWQYSNALPIESLISMSPATVGLQYSREASRGQVVLLPATATSLDPFQQAAAAAFVWPSYIPQGTAPATLQPPPNFIFPSMSPHSTLQAAAAAQPYATSLQLLGSNYLTAAAAAAAAAAANSTLCQHNQQTNSTSSSINLSLGANGVSGAAAGTTMSSSSSSTTTRFMSLASAHNGMGGGGGGGGCSINDTGQSKTKTMSALTAPPPLALAPGHSLITPQHHTSSIPPAPQPLLIPPSALKLEEWSSSDFMTAATSKTNPNSLTAANLQVQPPNAHFVDNRDKLTNMTTTQHQHHHQQHQHNATNLLELTTPATQALNLMRLPTPPTSATMESAAMAAAVNTTAQLQTQLLFQAAATPSPTPTLLNLTANLNRVTATNPPQTSPNVSASLQSMTVSAPLNQGANGYMNCSSNTSNAGLTANIGPPTPLGDDMSGLHFKHTPHLDASTSPQIVVGVPRALPSNAIPQNPPPQMQDVNIQTDTPVCSEDENSSCPLNQSQCTGGGNNLSGLNTAANSEQFSTAQCTPPLTQDDELYHDTEAQQPLELTKTSSAAAASAAAGYQRSETPQVESSTCPPPPLPTNTEYEKEDEEGSEVQKSPLKQQLQNEIECPPAYNESLIREERMNEQQQLSYLPAINPTSSSSGSNVAVTSNPEELTGLELLSHLSTSTLIKSSNIIRVKQEPLDAISEQTMCHITATEHHPNMELNSSLIGGISTSTLNEQQSSLILHNDNLAIPASAIQSQPLMELENLQHQQHQHHHMSPPPPPAVNTLAQSEDVEPLGGLKLLCALAEQRIQEEEDEVQSTSLNNTTGGIFRPNSSLATSPHHQYVSAFPQTSTSNFVKPSTASTSSCSYSISAEQNSSFPSLDTLELPTTSSATGTCFSAHITEPMEQHPPVKRKKHKHSKSSKSSSSNTNAGNIAGGTTATTTTGSSGSSKKSQKCGKKNKKKYSKEKKRHKLLAAAAAAGGAAETQPADLDFDDPQLQQELQQAFQNCVDPNFQRMGGKWPTPQEIFSIMESNMRMRLADITRQYRKKKRKLDEISKNKKKKKCSKLQAAAQQLSLVGNSALSLAASERASSSTSSNVQASALSSSPLCDYKFGKFSTNSSSHTTASTSSSSTSNYLAPSSFIRFATDSTKSQNHHHHHHHHLNTHPQFPPPPDLELENDNTTSTASTTTLNTPIYKPLRLEPSSLDQRSSHNSGGGGVGGSSGHVGAIRLAHKHASSEKLSHVIVCKEPKLGSSNSSHRSSAAEEDEEEEEEDNEDEDVAQEGSGGVENSHHQHHHNRHSTSDSESAKPHSSVSSKPLTMNPIDRSLVLTQDHLFRKETRVLTDMGGLFYAGIMKPLQPPDVYAITLDGERGNKSHIMSREEIFKDTILELAPKTIEDVTVGTRLCAYWSQQYRCLYPGRAIESESSDDGVTSQEFVSVEFDDGDSGRIRLQNIRLLLSDYPQVEYNDNPLYSLGKHKKSSVNKLSMNNDSNDHHHSSHGDEDHDADDGNGGRVTTNGSVKDYHQATAMEIFAAKRSEKKRNKSLKKRSQQNNSNSAAAAAAANGGVSSSANGGAANGSLESTDCSRKHHKHKKRKKHKKHRKNLMEIGIVSEMDKTSYNTSSSSAAAGTTSSAATAGYVKKTERTTSSLEQKISKQSHHHEQQQHQQQLQEQSQEQSQPEEDEEEEEEENYDEDNHHNTQTEDSQMADEDNSLQLARIKQEQHGNSSVAAAGGGGTSSSSSSSAGVNIKVKTEHLDMEEESTSNLMSEISDEAKADDMVEHNNSKGSKIAAFLPDRQLWGWLGTAYCKYGNKGSKGRIRKQFFKSIKRGKETITVGDCAVFLSTGRPDRPYIGRIESMWENSCNNKIVRVRWFYHPEETTGCPNLKYPGALFESPHEDENDVQTISHRCEVLQFGRYYNKFGSDSKQYQSIYDNNDTYYLAGYYNPRLQVLKLQDNIPTLEEQQQLQQQQQQQQNTTIILNNENNTNNTTTTTINNNHNNLINNTNNHNNNNTNTII